MFEFIRNIINAVSVTVTSFLDKRKYTHNDDDDDNNTKKNLKLKNICNKQFIELKMGDNICCGEGSE